MRLLLIYFMVIFFLSCTSNQSGFEKRKAFHQSLSKLVSDGKGKDKLFLPEDLKAEVFAESPQFFNPTNFDIDHKGRVWVTEAVNYRDFKERGAQYKHFSKGDRVMILEDLDHDGKADTSKVYVQDKDLQAPLGIAVFGNKVVVSCSPAIIIYTDTDGDDKPDKKEKFLTGFGGRDHDHGLHAVVAGPDGKWYFNTGNAGPHIVTDQSGWTLRAGSFYTGGTPYNTSNQPGLKSDDGRIWTGGLALRINPDGTGLKVMGHNFRNNYEITLDSYGNIWQNDNDAQVASCRTTWLMEGGNAGFFSKDGSRSWRADRRPGQSIQTAHWHQEDPGVIPSGDITGAGSPTAMMVYESDKLGKQYQGMVLNADAGRNEIFAYLPEKKGAGFNLNRHRLVSSVRESTEGYIWHEEAPREKWFRPSDVATGPDGALYIADWYDPVVGGHQMRDKEGYGRIYRITPKNKDLPVPKIDLETTEGQIKALLNPAVNVRYLGYQRLKSKGQNVFDEVNKILESEKSYHKARAIWLLPHLGKKGMERAEELLEAGDPDMRITSFRALKQFNPNKRLTYARALSKDSSSQVRREVAIALRDVPFEKSKDILLTLTKKYNGEDRWYLEALGIGLENKESAFYKLLKDKIENGNAPENWNQIMADMAWRLHPQEAIDDLSIRAQANNLPFEERKRALVALGFINDPKAAEAVVQLSKTADKKLANRAKWWLQYRKTNEWNAYLKDWENPDKNTLKTNPEIVKTSQQLNGDNFSLKKKLNMAKAMAKDSVGGFFLLSMAIQGQLPESVNQKIPEFLTTNPDPYLNILATRALKEGEQTDQYDEESILKLNGNPNKGKILFYRDCLTCHNMNDTGGDFGPDLSNIHTKFGEKAMLNAIIAPDEGVAFDNEPYLITTDDGRAVYGTMLTNGDIVVIKSIQGKQYVFENQDIKSKVKVGHSIMPGPEHFKMNNQDLADITAYLTNLES